MRSAMNENIERLYEEIGDELFEIVSDEFDTAWINVEMQRDSGSIGVYIKRKDEQYFSLDPTSTLFKLFNELWHEFKVMGPSPWTTATFIIQDSGKFTIDFGYDDISGGHSTSLERTQAWQKKYLGNVEIKER